MGEEFDYGFQFYNEIDDFLLPSLEEIFPEEDEQFLLEELYDFI